MPLTGNEDGVKHCAMKLLYSLQHLGYTIPPQADAGWVGEVGPGASYGDEVDGKRLGFDNDFTNRNTTFMTWNLMHQAKSFKNLVEYQLMATRKQSGIKEAKLTSKIPSTDKFSLLNLS